MYEEYSKMCRVCKSIGSRNIFVRPGFDSADGPLDRLIEKLRYVTLLKIEEKDNMPCYLCDLCIVQLNVAYNFKKQAVENDTKWKQIYIENGISLNQEENADTSVSSNSLPSSDVQAVSLHLCSVACVEEEKKSETIDCEIYDTDSSEVSNVCQKNSNDIFQGDSNPIMVYINDDILRRDDNSETISNIHHKAKKRSHFMTLIGSEKSETPLTRKVKKHREIKNLHIDMTTPVASANQNPDGASTIMKGNKALRYKEKYANQVKNMQKINLQPNFHNVKDENKEAVAKHVTFNTSSFSNKSAKIRKNHQGSQKRMSF